MQVLSASTFNFVASVKISIRREKGHLFGIFYLKEYILSLLQKIVSLSIAAEGQTDRVFIRSSNASDLALEVVGASKND